MQSHEKESFEKISMSSMSSKPNTRFNIQKQNDRNLGRFYEKSKFFIISRGSGAVIKTVVTSPLSLPLYLSLLMWCVAFCFFELT